MLIDAHIHLFPPEVRDDPAACRTRDQQFGLLYDESASMAGAAEAVAALDEAGIDAAVAYGFPWSDTGLARRHNEYLLEAAARFPGRLIPAACVHPLSSGAVEEAERALAAGARLLGEIGVYDRDLDGDVRPALEALAAVCRGQGKTLCLHTNEPVGHEYPGKAPMTLASLYRFIEAIPGQPVILCHWGGGLFFFSLLRKRVREVLADVYLDTAASPFLYRPRIYRLACDLVGADRVLLGTDFPLLGWARTAGELERAGIADEERALICGDNAARLLGLASPPGNG